MGYLQLFSYKSIIFLNNIPQIQDTKNHQTASKLYIMIIIKDKMEIYHHT